MFFFNERRNVNMGKILPTQERNLSMSKESYFGNKDRREDTRGKKCLK